MRSFARDLARSLLAACVVCCALVLAGFATTATTGFAAVPYAAGAPTGTPSGTDADHALTYYDNTHHEFWVNPGTTAAQWESPVACIDASNQAPARIVWANTGTLTASTDATIYNANAPWPFYVLDCWAVSTTALATGTLTLRDATGGTGNALSSALSTTTTTLQRNAITTDPTLHIVPVNGTLAIRRSATVGSSVSVVFVLIQRSS